MTAIHRRRLPAACLCVLLAAGGCKRDATEVPPKAPAPPAVDVSAQAREAVGADPTTANEDPQGPMALAFQDVERPYGDIPMLGLDGTERRLSEVATAKVVFVVSWATIHGDMDLTFAQQIHELLSDIPDAQVLVFSVDRAVSPEDRAVLQTLVKNAGVTVPVWTDRTLKLLSVVHHTYPESRRGGNMMWTAPLTAFSQGFESVERSTWDTDDLPALKAQLRDQVKRLVEEASAKEASAKEASAKP